MYCSSCGTLVSDDSIYWAGCGKKLYKNQNVPHPPPIAEKVKDERIQDLSKPKKASGLFLFFGYFFILFGGIVAIPFGSHLLNSRKVLPNGESVYKYRDEDRKHGKRIMTIGIIVLVIVIIFRFLNESGVIQE